MRYLLAFLALVLTVSLFSACSVEELEKYNEEFKGSWRTDVFYYPAMGDSIRNYILIDGKDSAFGIACKKDKPYSKCLSFQTGKAKYNKASKGLQIGNSIDQIHYVDREPFVNNGKWEMIIDSVSYYKY